MKKIIIYVCWTAREIVVYGMPTINSFGGINLGSWIFVDFFGGFNEDNDETLDRIEGFR